MSVDVESNTPRSASAGSIDPDTGRADFEAIVAPLMPALLAFFVRRVIPKHESADCLSETLIVLWKSRRTMPQGESDYRAWAFGVAHNILLNHRRGYVRRANLADRVRDEIQVQGQQTVSEEKTELVNALVGLPGKQRELVQLIVWDGFGVAEAGALLGLRANAARAAYARAKKKLRETLT